jgi:hypothetical protein
MVALLPPDFEFPETPSGLASIESKYQILANDFGKSAGNLAGK